MRVLHVMASGERGGGTDHLVGLLPELRRLAVDVTAATSGAGPLARRLENLGIVVARIEMMRSRVDARAIARLAHLIGASDPDLIHCHGTRAALFASLTPTRRPLVYTVHGLSYRQTVSPWRRGAMVAAELIACRRARAVVSVANADLIDLERRRLMPRDRGVHIPNAVDSERFSPGDRLMSRAALGLPKDRFLVGTVSRLVPQKSVQDLIAAVMAVEEAVLVIVGDGPDRGRLEAQAAGRPDKVMFLGARDDVPEVLRALDLFALSSRWEGEPIALLEAMATGLPCVATATTGAAELLAGGEAGVLVEIGEPALLAAAIQRLVRDQASAARLGRAARARMSTRTWATAAHRLAAVYREALGSSF